MRLTEEHDERLAKAAMHGHYPDPGPHEAAKDHTQFLDQARAFREMFNEAISIGESEAGSRSHRGHGGHRAAASEKKEDLGEAD